MPVQQHSMGNVPHATPGGCHLNLPLAQGQQELCVQQRVLLGTQEGLLLAAAGCMLGCQLSQLLLQAAKEQEYIWWQGRTSEMPG